MKLPAPARPRLSPWASIAFSEPVSVSTKIGDENAVLTGPLRELNKGKYV